MGFVFQYCWYVLRNPVNEIISDNHHSDPRGTKVFLRTCVNETKLLHINNLVDEIRRHITNKGYLTGDFWPFLPFNSPDSFITSDMSKRCILTKANVLRDVGELLIF